MTRPDEAALRAALCEIGRRVWTREYVASNDGNFSVRLGDGEILCTPTGVSKGFMEPEDLPVIDARGGVLRGATRPSSEIRMHLAAYEERPDVHAIVHAHPPHATAFAIRREPLPACVLPEIEMFIGDIPHAPYGTPGTAGFADSLRPFLRLHNAFLLTSHGALTLGADPFEAYFRMETVEQYCRILTIARQLGGWEQIAPSAVRELLDIRQKLGLPEHRSALPDAALCDPLAPGDTLPGGHDTLRAEIERIVRLVVTRLDDDAPPRSPRS